MRIIAEQWSILSRLFDEALELPQESRESWLESLGPLDPVLKGQLRSLLERHARIETSDFLDTLPNLSPTEGVAPDATDSALLRAGIVIGPYVIEQEVGRGGMGVVWRARRADGLVKRPVALKLMHAGFYSGELLARFARERDILAALTHPNIARLYDAGFTATGQPFLALEFVEGLALTEYCDDKRLDVRERLQLMLQVLTAVQYAHGQLVVHRDLKPSNILVTADGQVQLLDFGIAKLLAEERGGDTRLTQFGGRALTPDYASPEQIAGQALGTATDVYSLGVVLYELLTGLRPYKLKRNSRGALEEAILESEPVPPGHLTPTESAAHARATTPRKLAKILSGDLDTIVLKALSKSPAERYATANAFGEDIARFLRGDVVLAQRDRIAYRAAKYARRHRVAIAAASVVIITLAAGLAATTHEAEVASAERDAALQAHSRSLTQTAAERLKEGDVPVGLGIILEVLSHPAAPRTYTPEALSVFQEARAADAQIFAITGHTNRVRSVAFSPDGHRLITASYDKTARVWDSATGQHLMVLAGHTDRVTSAVFSPDGRRILTASVDKTVRVWDAATGQQIMLLAGHTDRVTCAAFSPDGQRILTASYDKTARVWDAASGQQTLLLSGHTEVVASAVFSPDGRHVITGSRDKTARIWDAATGRQTALLTRDTDALASVGFSPDGRRVITGSYDKTARIWDVETRQQILVLSGHTGLVSSVAFSADGQRVVTASVDKTVRIWDAATGRQTLLLSGHTSEVDSAAFSPDGQRVATGSVDKTARVWDAANGHQSLMLSGHTEPVSSAAFSPDGRRVVTASDDKTARIWDAATAHQIVLLSGHAESVWNVTFSPDGRRVLTASYD